MTTLLATLSDHLATVKQLLRLPVAHLVFDQAIAPANVRSTYRYYTKRHPVYKIIRHKTWGAALVDLGRFRNGHDYLDSIKGRNWGAHHIKRARARGYRLAEIERNDYVDAIFAINTSVAARQGRPMDQKYLEKQQCFDKLVNFTYYGVLDQDDQLVAYANVGRYGNFHAFEQLMGYRNNDGIMHLLVGDISAALVDQGLSRYLMYDTWFGALPGLRQFKAMLGFTPYRARYHLR
ncbi:hypothetical protein HF313_13640 [Massilia atriviolacea]|uniref:Uncharacterized protein n=1 Tax=Massilia atriviolacea TaxID=2495579 RepID=A0A430HQI5_9BURK|nr:hypothetical protein [Massilia atriviolacea]RSZ59782.1 hypothetical protein EJB06_06175 [Massilia atriviolacea]